MIAKRFYTNIFLIFLVVLYICINYLSAENNCLLTLKVYKNEIIVSVNGKKRLEQKINVNEGQIGLYFYSPEEDNYKQYINNLIINDLYGNTLFRDNFNNINSFANYNSSYALSKNLFSIENKKLVTNSKSCIFIKNKKFKEFILNLTYSDLKNAGIIFSFNNNKGLAILLRKEYNDIILTRIEDEAFYPPIKLVPFEKIIFKQELAKLLLLLLSLILKAYFLYFFLIFISNHLNKLIQLKISFNFNLNIKMFLFIVFISTFIFCSLISKFGFKYIPHIADETSYLFQAKIFAQGNTFALPLPDKIKNVFKYEHIIDKDKWYSKYFFGFPFILSLGVRLGNPYLINPLLSALALTFLVLLCLKVFDKKIAFITFLLAVSSPFFLILGSSLLAHSATLLCTVIFIFAFLKFLNSKEKKYFIFSGIAIGVGLTVRPYTMFAVSFPFFIFFIWQFTFEKKIIYLKEILILFFSVLPFFLMLLFVNKMYNKDFFLPSYYVWSNKDKVGFGENRGWQTTWGTKGFTPAEGLKNTNLFLQDLAKHLFGFPLGLSLTFFFWQLFFFKKSKEEWLLFFSLISLVFFHYFYWALHQVVLGPRYWYEGLPALLIFSALGIKNFLKTSKNPLPFILLFIVLFSYNLFIYFPTYIKALKNYAGVNADFIQMLKEANLKNAFVLSDLNKTYVNACFFLNSPDLKSDILCGNYSKESLKYLKKYFCDRKFYLWDGNVLKEIKF